MFEKVQEVYSPTVLGLKFRHADAGNTFEEAPSWLQSLLLQVHP